MSKYFLIFIAFLFVTSNAYSQGIDKTEVKTNPPAKSSNKAVVNTVVPSTSKPLTVEMKNEYIRILSQAQIAYEEHDYKLSLERFKQAYSIKQEEYVALNIATIFMILGDGQKCLQVVKDSKIRDPEVLSRFIIGFADKGRFDSVNSFIDLGENVLDNGDIAFAKGYLYEKFYDYDKASAHYKEALDLNRYNQTYLYSYARMFDMKGDYKEAFKLYNEAFVLAPKSSLSNTLLQRIDILKNYLDRGGK